MSFKVLHVLDHSIPLHSGYAFRTLSILREQRNLGWQTLQLTTPKQGVTHDDEESLEGFTFLRTRMASNSGLHRQLLATARRLEQAVDKFRPDLIHAHSPILTALPSLYVARRHNLPVVYEMRATWEDAAVDHGTTTVGSIRYRLSQAAETFVLRRADAVTTICAGLRDEIVSRGISPAKVTVIPNAVDVEHFSPGSDNQFQSKNRDGSIESTTIGFIGSFYAYEGLDLLLKATSIIIAGGVKLRVVLVGGGPEDKSLRDEVECLGLSEYVQFVGRVSHDEVRRYYASIDVFVYPRRKTRLTELVTPLKPLEAMVQGKVVVASDVGGHRELIRDGETGIFFKADDVQALVSAIRKLLKERSSWNFMQANAKQFAREERNWSGSVAKYRDTYRSAIIAKGCNVGDIE